MTKEVAEKLIERGIPKPHAMSFGSWLQMIVWAYRYEPIDPEMFEAQLEQLYSILNRANQDAQRLAVKEQDNDQ